MSEERNLFRRVHQSIIIEFQSKLELYSVVELVTLLFLLFFSFLPGDGSSLTSQVLLDIIKLVIVWICFHAVTDDCQGKFVIVADRVQVSPCFDEQLNYLEI